MKSAHSETLALRREAIAARAALQRAQLRDSLAQAGRVSMAAKGVGTLALGLSRLLVQPRREAGTVRARPWMLSAGVLLLRALRASPTARWVAGAAAVGGAIWWVARAIRTPDMPDEESSDQSG